jgi:mannose-6-phosphate isomerase-like protein (cupin superfamily)
MLEKVRLSEKFALFDQHWQPKIVGELNDFYVKIVKIEGEFVWHHHDLEDELFVIIEGEIAMHYRDDEGAERIETFGPGEFLIVPRGVEHKPVATTLTKMMLIEPKNTVNTGNAGGERTAEAQWI